MKYKDCKVDSTGVSREAISLTLFMKRKNLVKNQENKSIVDLNGVLTDVTQQKRQKECLESTCKFYMNHKTID